MTTYTPETAISRFFQNNNVWTSLVESLDAFVVEAVIVPTTHLRDIRDISLPTDETTKWLTLRQLGYAPTFSHEDPSDLMMSVYDQASSPPYLGAHVPTERRISRVLGTPVSIHPLWTSDYEQWQRVPPDRAPLDQGGPWFQSTHVEMDVDWAAVSTRLPGDTANILYSTFYQFAPLNLVLVGIADNQRFDVPTCFCVNLSGQVAVQYI